MSTSCYSSGKGLPVTLPFIYLAQNHRLPFPLVVYHPRANSHGSDDHTHSSLYQVVITLQI